MQLGVQPVVANLPGKEKPVKAFILSGQSNAAGYNDIGELRTRQDHFNDLTGEHSRVLFWPGTNALPDFSGLIPAGATVFDFHGYQGYDFEFRNRNAKIVVPSCPAPGSPWIWRARFWGHEPQTDIALLERGFHVVYCDVSELFGNKEALSIWDEFYQKLRRAGLAKKSVMEGMSRGGVYEFR